MWLVNSGERADVTYRIRFAESVSGLAVGDPVKFHARVVSDVGAVPSEIKEDPTVLLRGRKEKSAPPKDTPKPEPRGPRASPAGR